MRKLFNLLLTIGIIAAFAYSYKEPIEDYMACRERSCEEMLLETFYTADEEVYLLAYGLSEYELQRIWNHVISDSGELFHMAPTYEYTLLGSTVLSVNPKYTMDYEAYQSALTVYRAYLEEILSGVNPNWSDLQKALYLHDIIALRYEYDESTILNNAYEMVTEGKAVCQGYTDLYGDLLKACGIPCSYIISDEMRHTWNVVTLNGAQYHVDVTHDDPVADRLGRVLHENFLRSDAALPDHSFTTAEGLGRCTDTSYDSGAVWEDITSAFVPVGDAFYFIRDGKLYKWRDGDSYFVNTIDATWYTDSTKTQYWEGHFSTLCASGEYLLYSKPKQIVSYLPADGTYSIAYSYNGPGDIYGMQYVDGILRLQVGSSPNEPGEIITVNDFVPP